MSTRTREASGNIGANSGGINRVYQQLRADILALHLRSGEMLDEGELAERFGCKRRAVREALLKLSSDGWVELLADRGARVTRIDLAELPRFIEAIDLVSRAINRYAAERRSPGDLAAIESASRLFDVEVTNGDAVALAEHNRSFHMAVAAAADNGYLHDAYRRLFDQGARMMHLALGQARTPVEEQQQHLAQVSADHAELICAIRNQDGAQAEAVARAHTALFRQRVSDYLGRDGSGEVNVQSDPI